MLRCITYISNAKLITGKHYVKLVRVIYFPDALILIRYGMRTLPEEDLGRLGRSAKAVWIT
jgi:hypothetical protein